MFLELKDVTKSYGGVENKIQVLNGISFSVKEGDICVILGSSGSGKSTLLNCIGGLDSIDSGSILVDGVELSKLNQKQLLSYRRDSLGFVFQSYNLIPNLTVKENIEVCKYLTKNPIKIDELLNILGIKDQENKFPNTLSGGQQQRCAIARAVIKNPKILLCDEPTGALDSKSAKDILELLEKINKTYNTTILLVTHNLAIKPMAHQVVSMCDGLIKESYRNEKVIDVKDIEGL